MKFVAISDTHCRHQSLKLPKADAIIHAGDFTYRGDKEEVTDFLNWFSRLKYRHKIFIAGNHDFFFERKEKEVPAIVPEGVTYLKDSGITIQGISIWGSPVTPWFYSWAFNRQRGVEIKKHWKLIPKNTDVLITHGPVYGILDTVVNEKKVGCKDLLSTVFEIKPKVHVCGHIHEGYGKMEKEGIQFINASVLNENYELTNQPVVFEVN